MKRKWFWIVIIGLLFIWFWAWYVYLFGSNKIPDHPRAIVSEALRAGVRDDRLTGIFFQNQTSPRPSPSQGEGESVEWTLLITGDVLPARVVNQKMVAKNDFSWPLVNITQILKNADVTLINLETPLLENCPVTSEGMVFCGDSRFAEALKDTGVDMVNLANNHTLNHGWEGLVETEKHLLAVGIETTGFTSKDCYSSSDPPWAENREVTLENEGSSRLRSYNNPYCSRFTILNIKNIRLGFLGYNAVGQSVDRSLVEQEIKTADTQVDVLIVSVHWGKEYVREPQPDFGIAPDDPKELGRLFIDWGADVVVGNHPHWWQPMEMYSPQSDLLAESFDSTQDKLRRSATAKPIFYALGNTIFDQEWSQETKEGFLARLHFLGSDYTDRL